MRLTRGFIGTGRVRRARPQEDARTLPGRGTEGFSPDENSGFAGCHGGSTVAWGSRSRRFRERTAPRVAASDGLASLTRRGRSDHPVAGRLLILTRHARPRRVSYRSREKLADAALAADSARVEIR